MKQYRLGLIGAGNMAAAIVQGAIGKKALEPQHTMVYDIDTDKAQKLAEKTGIGAADSMAALLEGSDILILAVKPNVIEKVLESIKDSMDSKPIVSIAAGWSAKRIGKTVGKDKKVLRLMPNTPLMVGEGMTVFESPCNLDDDEREYIEHIFASLGQIAHAPEKLMDAVTAVSGSGPAYVYMFIEALSDAGVLVGLPREMAMQLATQTVMGASRMVVESGRHPGELKDAVCSPGGTTIEAVKSLENDGLRGTVINAVEKCAAKSKKLAE